MVSLRVRIPRHFVTFLDPVSKKTTSSSLTCKKNRLQILFKRSMKVVFGLRPVTRSRCYVCQKYVQVLNEDHIWPQSHKHSPGIPLMWRRTILLVFKAKGHRFESLLWRLQHCSLSLFFFSLEMKNTTKYVLLFFWSENTAAWGWSEPRVPQSDLSRFSACCHFVFFFSLTLTQALEHTPVGLIMQWTGHRKRKGEKEGAKKKKDYEIVASTSITVLHREGKAGQDIFWS